MCLLGREEELKRRYCHLYKHGVLIIPDRYNLHKFRDPAHFQAIQESYKDNVQQYFIDRELIELLGYTDSNYARALQLHIDSNYQKLPERLKFPVQAILDNAVVFHGFTNGIINSSIFIDGIIIGAHKFISLVGCLEFDYDAYVKYYNEMFFSKTVHPQVYVGSDCRVRGFDISDSPLHINTPLWQHLFTFDIEEIWDEFKKANCYYNNESFRYCHLVVQQIEAGVPQCFTFGQFIQVFPLLKGMKKQIQRRKLFNRTKPNKFIDFIYDAELVCSSDFSMKQMKYTRPFSGKINMEGKKRLPTYLKGVECNVTYKIIVDRKHAVVFIKQLGKHTRNCSIYQRHNGYPFTKRHILSERYNLDASLNKELLIHYGKYEIERKNTRSWFYDDKNKYLPIASKGTYMEQFSLLTKCLEDKQTSYIVDGKIETFTLDSNLIVREINYDKGPPGLLVGSKYSISGLANQSIIGIDVTFNVCALSSFNLITVVFRDDAGKIVLGCVGFLNGGESAGNMQEFAKVMVEVAQKVEEKPFRNLQYVITDDSQGTNIGLTNIFAPLKAKYRVDDCIANEEQSVADVRVVKCAWHKRNNFIDNLDCVGVTLLTEAMWTRNPVICQAKIDTVLLYYDELRRIFKKIIKSKAKVEIKTFRKLKNKSIKKAFSTSISCHEMVKTMNLMYHYVKELQRDRESWCLCFRLCLPPGHTTSDLDPHSEEVRNSIRQESINVASYENLNIYETVDVEKVFNAFVAEACGIEKQGGSDIPSSIEKLKQNFEKDFAEYSALLGMGQVGLKMVTTSNNESIHNALKNHYKMKRVPTLMQFFDKLQNYFMKKAKPVVKRNPALHHLYPFTENMNREQLLQFDGELKKLNSRIERVEADVSLLHKRGAHITKHICGCSVRAHFCVPCCHMMLCLKLEVKKRLLLKYEAEEQERRRQIHLNYDSEEDSDMEAMEFLVDDGDDRVERRKVQFENDLRQGFVEEMGKQAEYAAIVLRKANFEKVIEINAIWNDATHYKPEDLEECLGRYHYITSNSSVTIVEKEIRNMMNKLQSCLSNLQGEEIKNVEQFFIEVDELLGKLNISGKHGITSINVRSLLSASKLKDHILSESLDVSDVEFDSLLLQNGIDDNHCQNSSELNSEYCSDSHSNASYSYDDNDDDDDYRFSE